MIVCDRSIYREHPTDVCAVRGNLKVHDTSLTLMQYYFLMVEINFCILFFFFFFQVFMACRLFVSLLDFTCNFVREGSSELKKPLNIVRGRFSRPLKFSISVTKRVFLRQI